MKRALILGVGGMDGSLLAELLLGKGYTVYGLHRRSSVDNLARVRHLVDKSERFTLVRGDLTDPTSIQREVARHLPHEIYNMADQDEVGWSGDLPGYSARVTFAAVQDLLEIVLRYQRTRPVGTDYPPVRFFQPVSVTVFGTSNAPVTEDTPLNPMSPYAVCKAAAWLACKHYRREHGLHVCCGVMGNHEHYSRGPQYLLQRIARQAVELAAGKREKIELAGSLDHVVDVGWAPEYVEAAWRMVQAEAPAEAPDDYVVATGRDYSVGALVATALKAAGGPIPVSLSEFVSNSSPDRPGPAATLVGDAGKAIKVLDWEAEKGAAHVVRLLVARLREGGK